MNESWQEVFRAVGTTDGASTGAKKVVPISRPISSAECAVLKFDRYVFSLASGVNAEIVAETSDDGETWTVAMSFDPTTSTGWTYADWFNSDAKGFLRIGAQVWNTSGSASLPFDIGYLATFRRGGARVSS